MSVMSQSLPNQAYSIDKHDENISSEWDSSTYWGKWTFSVANTMLKYG
jgi:hypothetical protein